MKISKTQLRQLIKEELAGVLAEEIPYLPGKEPSAELPTPVLSDKERAAQYFEGSEADIKAYSTASPEEQAAIKDRFDFSQSHGGLKGSWRVDPTTGAATHS